VLAYSLRPIGDHVVANRSWHHARGEKQNIPPTGGPVPLPNMRQGVETQHRKRHTCTHGHVLVEDIGRYVLTGLEGAFVALGKSISRQSWAVRLQSGLCG